MKKSSMDLVRTSISIKIQLMFNIFVYFNANSDVVGGYHAGFVCCPCTWCPCKSAQSP